MKNKSTLKTWKKLQDKDYFGRLTIERLIPKTIPIKDIENKVVVEIGCGYGRDTAYISTVAKKVYGIEVSETILIKAKRFILKHGNYAHTKLVLVDEYKEKIPNNIDYVYSKLVFQHMTPEQAQDYIDTFYKKLKVGGKIQIQFRLGTKSEYPNNAEPHIRYTKEKARKLFSKYKIVKEQMKHDERHFYITAVKGYKF